MDMHIVLLDLGHELRGGQRQVFYLAQRLADSPEFSCVVAAPRNAPLLHMAADAGLPVLPLGGRRAWDPRTLYTLMRHLRGRTCILHTNDAHSAGLGAWLHSRSGGATRLLHTRRVSYPLRQGWRGRKYLLADAVVGVSAEIAQVMRDSGMPAEKVHVIHSGIDASLYTPRTTRQDGRLVIGMVGALTRQKGHDVFVRALGELHRGAAGTLPPWEARIIGSGPLFESLLELARQEGVESRMACLGWQDSRVMMPGFDILAVPSVDGEGSSAVIKEGWAVGLPVIASDLASNLELVRHEDNGLAFANGDHGALARGIARLASDAGLCARLVQGGRQSLEEFTDVRMAGAYMRLYRSLLV
jgi:glycosyltransferase involved in cell wall biosynthesis